ncbi:hypothetical protein D6D20_04211 [Aureobasidium pullulans]|uniref:Uncharacterized protein n=1 Tax=Aureobasidium pullulans TaxID=5580 RepID=A0A4S8ZAP8_AURPU|nr:hypothetical protein D6D20_04211 [Aureobasidium pullulans]
MQPTLISQTRLAEDKSFQRLECRSDGGRWAISYQQHLEQPLLNRKIGVPISGRKRVTVLPLLRAIEEVAWAGAASSEATMITAQKQQLTALRTSIRHPSRMGVDGDADDERSPPPLRRTSGDSSSPSLRERYMEKDQGGLGINLSEVGSFKDDGTTMGVDGDADDERSRESESLITPISNAFNSLWTPRVKAERERKRKDFAKALRNMNQRVDDLHTENVERLADMTKKMDRAIKSDGKFQIQLDNIRESLDAIGVAFVQFGMDDEKVQLIADKVIDALHPIVTKGHEQNKADTKRR